MKNYWKTLASVAMLGLTIQGSLASNFMEVGVLNYVYDPVERKTYSSSVKWSESWCGSGQWCDAPATIRFGSTGYLTNEGTGNVRRMIYTYQVNDFGPLQRVCRIHAVMDEETSRTCRRGSGQGFVTGFCSGYVDVREEDCTATGYVILTY